MKQVILLKKGLKKVGLLKILFKKRNSLKKVSQKTAQKSQLTQKIIQKRTKKIRYFYLQDQICITVGPWLMKLYIATPSILTLVTWVPQSRLA